MVASEVCRRGDCRLAVGHVAALAGVCETVVRNALREARRLGLVEIEERRVTGWRNLPNVVRLASEEWRAWLHLAKGRSSLLPAGMARVARSPQTAPALLKGGGCRSVQGTPTDRASSVNSGKRKPAQAAGGQGRRSVIAT